MVPLCQHAVLLGIHLKEIIEDTLGDFAIISLEKECEENELPSNKTD